MIKVWFGTVVGGGGCTTCRPRWDPEVKHDKGIKDREQGIICTDQTKPVAEQTSSER